MTCPHCHHTLSDAEIRSIKGQHAQSKRTNFRRKVSPDQLAAIITRYDAGETCRALAREFNISPQSLGQRIIRAKRQEVTT